MDYIFGQDTLKTVGDSHSGLSGFCSIIREYPDQNITDNFTVVDKIKSDEDSEGKCYDWYLIKEHYRYTDKTKVIEQKAQENDDALFDIAALADENSEAIMELAEMIAGMEG